MASFTIPDNPMFNLTMRMLERTDPALADLFNAMFAQLLENDAYIMNKLPSSDTYITGADGVKYRWGMDAEGVYLEPVTTTETEDGLQEAVLLLSDSEDTGYYAEIDGETKSIENIVESESALTETTYCYNLI